MSFNSASLLQELDELARVAGNPSRYVIAFSGGLDSTVLAHALLTSRAEHATPVVAVYVDHGLQQQAADWRRHCEAFAARFDIEFHSLAVTVDPESGKGLEAAAREARYAALQTLMQAGDWLLSAHHRDDQAETVLQNLLRSSGPAGLAGIGRLARMGPGWLVRPLLGVTRASLQEYAAAHALEFIEDPSNRDRQFDRNYLRHEVLPRFEARWPDVARRLQRSAALAGEAAELLADLAAIDAQALGDRPDCLALGGLRALSRPRQRNVLRHVIAGLGLPPPGSVHLEQILAGLVEARADAEPLVAWPGARARRYRDRLYLLPGGEPPAPPAAGCTFTGDRLSLPDGLGVLALEHGAPQGVSAVFVKRGLTVRFRSGGEKIKPINHKHTKKLKKLLQEAAVVPWMRELIPLVYAGDELVAVGDLWLAASAASSPGTAFHWLDRPPIH